MQRVRKLAAIGLIMMAGCHGPSAPVENLGGRGDVSRFMLRSISGTRDGDRLDVEAIFGDGAAKQIRLDLRFSVGAPTRLESGTWSGLGSEGAVRERSVTFLGGQSGPPSVGGRFDLLGPDRVPRYRVSIPVEELKNRR